MPVRESGNRCSRARRRARCGRSRSARPRARRPRSSSMSTETLVFSLQACMCLIDCCAGGRVASPRHISIVSSMPSPSDWRRSATSRSGKLAGNSFSPSCSVVEILADHRRVVDHACRRRAAGSAAGSADFPSSARCSASRPRPPCGPSRCGPASPHSCAAIITLRTNGERGDQCSSIFAVIAFPRSLRAWHQSPARKARSAFMAPPELSSWPRRRAGC